MRTRARFASLLMLLLSLSLLLRRTLSLECLCSPRLPLQHAVVSHAVVSHAVVSHAVVSPPPAGLRVSARRHAGVLGLAALVGAYPYDVPNWMPEILVLLAQVLHCKALMRRLPQC
jgi:hypothetical protein